MSIRTDISQRTSPDITIVRTGGDNVVVPITVSSTRRFMLMQEDFIQLEFSLAEPVHFAIGDYIQDEVFGRFVITTEQMPRYNSRTGGYGYTLRFDAEYMGWKNWLHCLAVNGKRMESRWNLTDRLDTHARQVADNINIITEAEVTSHYDTQTGVTVYNSTGYGIDITSTNAAEIKHLAYEGVNIIEAMNAIAQEWSCEWWATNDSVTNGNTTYAKTIHFGKCESGSPYTMILGNNVETMDITRDTQSYCNRLFAYGGTRNIPEDYDRHLEFSARTTNSWTYFYDANKPLTLNMIDAEPTVAAVTMPLGTWSQGGTNAERTYTQSTSAVNLSGKYTFDIALSTMIGISSDAFVMADLPDVSLSATLHYGEETNLVRIRNYRQGEIIDGVGWFADLSFSSEIDLGSTLIPVYLEIVWTMVVKDTHAGDDVQHETTGRAQAVSSSANKAVQVVFNGNTYNCTFNGSNGRISPKPSGLTNGSKYTIANLIMPNVPLSWFTVDYDAGTLATVGEKRLHMPLTTYPNRYIDAEGGLSAQQIVEQTVIFDDIYPMMTLRIKAGTLVGEDKQQRVDHSDGSVSYEDWTQWSFEVEMLVDEDNDTWGTFPFFADYILDGHTLQAVFSAPTTANATGHLLAGMTFDVGFSNNRYTIIRNEDYGTLLPNKRLVPTEGDTLFLTGWNPRYISDLDMVAIAEQRLATKAAEYLQAVQEGQFTFTCRMMSDVMMAYPFCTGSDQNGRRMFGLLSAGHKVIISHDGLPGGSKESRIIGYEYKLDMPYNTPTYTVGETEAYSRLKQLEKQIQRL